MVYRDNKNNYIIILISILLVFNITSIILISLNDNDILKDNIIECNKKSSTSEIPTFWENVFGYQFSENTPDWESCSMVHSNWYNFTINYDLSVNIYLGLVVAATENFVGQDSGWEGHFKINGKTIILFDRWTTNGTYTWFEGDNRTIIRNRSLWWDITPYLTKGYNTLSYWHYCADNYKIWLKYQILNIPYIFKSDFTTENGWYITDPGKIWVNTVNNRLEWSTDSNFNKALKSTTIITLFPGDVIFLKSTYISHYDPNCTQSINLGLSNIMNVSLLFPEYINAITLTFYSDEGAQGHQISTSCVALIDGVKYNLMPDDHLPPNNTYRYEVEITVLNTTHINIEVWRNGITYFNSIREVPLAGTHFNYYGASNLDRGFSPLQGSFQGYSTYLAVFRGESNNTNTTTEIPAFQFQIIIISMLLVLIFINFTKIKGIKFLEI
ncbi:MAG: hypothetical protein ACTSRP_24675 [Candidatus Helarchaeota archaeon]